MRPPIPGRRRGQQTIGDGDIRAIVTAVIAALTLAIPTVAHAGDRSDTAKRLNRGLAGSPMRGLGWILEAEGYRYGVSPYFMAAAAATESSLGRAGCSNNPRNVWGLASCTNSWPVPYFGTWREAIRFYARFLHDRWPNATSPFHYYGYAECSDCWGRKTAYWMGRLFGVGTYTRYGQ